MITTAALIMMAQTVTPPEARRPPDERLQTHGQNAVVKNDPAGMVNIVAEDPGSCPGPGPTTIMRLRSTDKVHTQVVTVARSVNIGGKVTTSTSSHTLGPLAAVKLGCLAEPGRGKEKPALVNEWKIVAAQIQ